MSEKNVINMYVNKLRFEKQAFFARFWSEKGGFLYLSTIHDLGSFPSSVKSSKVLEMNLIL